MFALGALRYLTLRSNGYDLAYFDQVVWNAAGGRGFVSSFSAYPFFGQHFSPGLAIFVPLYWIRPSPLWLLAGQSTALGLAVLPLYALAARLLRPGLAWVACVVYLLQLFVARAVEFDFHTESLAVPFVFGAVLAAAAGQDRRLLLLGAAPLLGKEDGALVSFGIGLLALVLFKRRAGGLLMLAATAWAVAVVFFLMPAIRHGQPSDVVLRYGYLADGWTSALAGVADHLSDPAALAALALFLLGLGLLPLARPLALAAATPPLLLAMLSDARGQHLLQYQYGLQIGPLLIVAALLGWQRLAGDRRLALALLPAAAAVLVTAAPRPQLDGFGTARQADPVLASIPGSAPVSASSLLLPRLSERPDVVQVPLGYREYLVLDERAPAPASAVPAGYELVRRSGPFSLWEVS